MLAALIAAPNTNSETDNDLLSTLLHIIIAAAAISRGSYPSPQVASETLSTVLTVVNEQRWGASTLGPVRLGYANVWRHVSCAHGLINVERLSSNFIVTCTTDTCQQIDALVLQTEDPIDDDFSMEVIDLLLETLANIALQGDDGTATSIHPLASSIE